MLAFDQYTCPLYSRTFPLLLVGVESALWIAIYFLVEAFQLTELHADLGVVSLLGWVATVRLVEGYRPESVRGSQQVYQTLLLAVFHSSCLWILCVLVGWQSYIASVLYINFGFYLFRVMTLSILYGIYQYWKIRSNNTIRFITVGQTYICQHIVSHLLLSNAKHVGHVSSEDSIEDLLISVEKECVAYGANHIYCAVPLANLKPLQQLADHHFIYLHWTPINQLCKDKQWNTYLVKA